MAREIDLLERQRRLAWYLILPAVFVVFLVIGFPLVQVIVYSFMKIKLDGVTPPSFVGIDNYLFIFSDSDFWHAVWVTLIFSFFSVTIEGILGLTVALVANSKFKGRTYFASCYSDSLGDPDRRVVSDLEMDVQRHLWSREYHPGQSAYHSA